MNSTVALVLAVTVMVAFALPLLGKNSRGGTARFKARNFLSANEMEFLQRLEAAAPELRFHAQVAMGALLAPAVAKTGNGREYFRMRNMFNQKIIDYVAQRRDDGRIVAVIELDDRTHNSAKDAKRDAMLQQAGYRTLRWQSKSRPSRAEIFAALMGPLPEVAAATPAPTPPVSGKAGVRGELWARTVPAALKPTGNDPAA